MKIIMIMIMMMMMMLPMQSWFRPEADPAVLLAWIETEEDLTAIHNAAKVWAFVGSLRHSDGQDMPDQNQAKGFMLHTKHSETVCI